VARTDTGDFVRRARITAWRYVLPEHLPLARRHPPQYTVPLVVLEGVQFRGYQTSLLRGKHRRWNKGSGPSSVTPARTSVGSFASTGSPHASQTVIPRGIGITEGFQRPPPAGQAHMSYW